MRIRICTEKRGFLSKQTEFPQKNTSEKPYENSCEQNSDIFFEKICKSPLKNHVDNKGNIDNNCSLDAGT